MNLSSPLVMHMSQEIRNRLCSHRTPLVNIMEKRLESPKRRCVACNDSIIKEKAVKFPDNALLRTSWLLCIAKLEVEEFPEVLYLCARHFKQDDVIVVSEKEVWAKYGALPSKKKYNWEQRDGLEDTEISEESEPDDSFLYEKGDKYQISSSSQTSSSSSSRKRKYECSGFMKCCDEKEERNVGKRKKGAIKTQSFIPDEIICSILVFLNLNQLEQCQWVNRRWNKIIKANENFFPIRTFYQIRIDNFYYQYVNESKSKPSFEVLIKKSFDRNKGYIYKHDIPHPINESNEMALRTIFFEKIIFEDIYNQQNVINRKINMALNLFSDLVERIGKRIHVKQLVYDPDNYHADIPPEEYLNWVQKACTKLFITSEMKLIKSKWINHLVMNVNLNDIPGLPDHVILKTGRYSYENSRPLDKARDFLNFMQRNFNENRRFSLYVYDYDRFVVDRNGFLEDYFKIFLELKDPRILFKRLKLGRYAVQSIVRQRDRKFFRNLLGIKVTRKDSPYLNHEDAEIYEYKRSDEWAFICDFSMSNTWHDVKIMRANAE